MNARTARSQANGWTYEDPSPIDAVICSRFGNGAFPCGPVVKIRVSKNITGVGWSAPRSRRWAMCQAHYVFDTTDIKVSGGPSGLKTRAKTIAMQRLAAAHMDEFQTLYEEALAQACAATEPPLDPNLLLGRDGAA